MKPSFYRLLSLLVVLMIVLATRLAGVAEDVADEPTFPVADEAETSGDTPEPLPEPDPTPEPTLPTEAPAETPAPAFGAFTVEWVEVAPDGDMLSVLLVTGSSGYDRIYIGSRGDEVKEPYYTRTENGGGTYAFRFHLPTSALGARISFVPGCADGAWNVDGDLSFDVPTAEVNLLALAEPTDGDYTIDVESNSPMSKVVSCKLNMKDSVITATIALSGTGYDKLFLGTAADAALADPSQYINYTLNADNLYSFNIPVSALDVQIAIAAYSTKSASWFDRTLTFQSATLLPIGGATPTAAPTATPTPELTKAPELDGSTKDVDNSTSLADGTYTPDSFTFSGGTGRVTITSPSVTVKGGKAFVTIVLSSPNYAYVKASGNKYFGSHSADSSTFVIPVKLSADNAIIGMTTAMSQDHEVKYTINVYIAAADASAEEAAAADAPIVSGLRYESTDANDFAESFAVHHYTDGYTMLSIAGEAEKTDYLLVPEGTEVPAGVGECVTVIQLPIKNAYVASSEMLELMVEIGFLDPFTLIGCETGVPGTFAGEYTAPDYSVLLLGGCDLAILPAAATGAEIAAVSGDLALLGIPLFVDRSADEATEEARLEWLKLYGILFGCEDLVEQYLAEPAAQ